MFLSLTFLGFLTLPLRPGHIFFFTDSDFRGQEYYFGTSFRVRPYFLGLGFGDKVFISLAQVPNTGCVSFPGLRP